MTIAHPTIMNPKTNPITKITSFDYLFSRSNVSQSFCIVAILYMFTHNNYLYFDFSWQSPGDYKIRGDVPIAIFHFLRDIYNKSDSLESPEVLLSLQQM